MPSSMPTARKNRTLHYILVDVLFFPLRIERYQPLKKLDWRNMFNINSKLVGAALSRVLVICFSLKWQITSKCRGWLCAAVNNFHSQIISVNGVIAESRDTTINLQIRCSTQTLYMLLTTENIPLGWNASAVLLAQSNSPRCTWCTYFWLSGG